MTRSNIIQKTERYLGGTITGAGGGTFSHFPLLRSNTSPFKIGLAAFLFKISLPVLSPSYKIDRANRKTMAPMRPKN